MDNVHSFLSFPRATIKSEGRLRAARNSFLPPSVVPSFLFFLHRCRLSLAFLTATRPRDSPADNLRYDTSAVRCSSAARGIHEEIFTGLLISSFSLVRKKELTLRFARSRERYFLETRTLCLPIRKAPKIPDSFSPSSLTYNSAFGAFGRTARRTQITRKSKDVIKDIDQMYKVPSESSRIILSQLENIILFNN